MLALIRKRQNEAEWITGYCGSASEIILQFLNSGVRELYQRVWMQTSGNAGDVVRILNELQSKGMAETATRQDVVGIVFCLGEIEYQCIGCAETKEEANELCNLLEAINKGNSCTSPYRLKWYSRFMAVTREYSSDTEGQEVRKVLASAMNLRL